MENLITLDNLIKQAKSSGVDFGKGDPYNRLRYYTKLGWLPHMIRKQGKGKTVEGHYPFWALERLLLIEKLKKIGLPNDEIEKKIKGKNKIQPIINMVKAPGAKLRLILYIIVILLTIVLAHELEIINLGKRKSLITVQTDMFAPSEIIASGTAFVLKNQTKTFVKTKSVQEHHKIYVAFNNNITPAVRFWIGDKKPLEGFYVELDAPIANEVEFNWWVTK